MRKPRPLTARKLAERASSVHEARAAFDVALGPEVHGITAVAVNDGRVLVTLGVCSAAPSDGSIVGVFVARDALRSLAEARVLDMVAGNEEHCVIEQPGRNIRIQDHPGPYLSGNAQASRGPGRPLRIAVRAIRAV